jgi:CheY-like chemotaxis protein
MRLEENAREHDLLESVILLVEDNEEDIVLLKRAFRNAHVANPLRVVKDGEEAIRYLAGNGTYADRARHPMPFLLLLDLRLPKLSGFEVLAWIRDQPELAELIVIVLTGSDHVPDMTKARELGANSYLVKPGTFEELMEMVKRINGRWVLLDKRPEESASREAPRAR